MGKKEQVCGVCWRASCNGRCETPQQRTDRQRREAVAKAAKKLGKR
jgi:hypothetical protein